MAKATKPKNNKRRSAKKPAPLSSKKKTLEKKVTNKPTAIKPKAAKSANKTKKQTAKTRPRTVAKKTPKARPKAKSTKQLIGIPLGGGVKLVISINRTKSRPTKAAKRKSTKKQFNKRRELAFSLFFVFAGLAGTLFFGMHTLASPSPSFTPTSSQQVALPPPPASLPRSTPVRLKIPDISVDTPLTTVGLRQDGTIEVPAQFEEAGWYKNSPTPGEIGPSIIVGHLDNVSGIAVFWRLRELVPGQVISVERQDQTTANFKVLKLNEFAQDNFPTDDVYGNIKYAGLRLITCGGTFNRLTGHYDANIVVFAALIPPAR